MMYKLQMTCSMKLICHDLIESNCFHVEEKRKKRYMNYRHLSRQFSEISKLKDLCLHGKYIQYSGLTWQE